MQREAYDSKGGIRRSLDSLAHFYDVVRERYRARHERGERLNTFYVLGSLCLDEAGNVMKLQLGEIFPHGVPHGMPSVLTPDEFHRYRERYGGNAMVSMEHFQVPPPHARDPISGQGWDIDTCTDAVAEDALGAELDISDFAGQTFADVKAYFSALTGAIYRMSPADRVWNSQQFSAHEAGIDEVEAVRTVSDADIVQAGDRVGYAITYFYHGDSHNLRLRQQRRAWVEQQRMALRELFERTGFTGVAITVHDMPAHTVDALVGPPPDSDEERIEHQELRSAIAHASYLSVSSEQGTFGVILCEGDGPPMIDLSGSEVTSHMIALDLARNDPEVDERDVEESIADSMPAQFLPMTHHDVIAPLRDRLAGVRQ